MALSIKHGKGWKIALIGTAIAAALVAAFIAGVVVADDVTYKISSLTPSRPIPQNMEQVIRHRADGVL